MRRAVCLILVFLAFSSTVCAESQMSAEAVSEIIRRAAPADFGYVDNTEYAMQRDFAVLSFVDDSCIVVCAESTNFSEFGVFHVKNEKDVRRCERYLQSYLNDRKAQFESGVIYDVAEYPKFENASVFSVGQFIVYAILDTNQLSSAQKAVRSFIK